ncbi:MAG: lytic transglycosylase domain-containing protein [Candidatus Acidiferrales bacterium]
MNPRSVTIAVLAAGIWLSSTVTPVRGQIAAVDSHGKLIYMNGDSPKPSRGSTISIPPVTGADAGKVRAVSSAPGDTGIEKAPVRADARLERIVQAAAARHQLDPALIKAVISTESGWNTHAVSQKGALGLMQLVPATAQRFGVGNPFDPAENVEGGTTYLESLLRRYNGDLTKSLAAYNAGERAVDESGGVPAYPETRNYVQKVTHAYFRPGSGRTSTLWTPPRDPVRREIEPNGRVVFTNE